jgi:hypothetical protein
VLLAQLFQPGIERLNLGFQEPKLTKQAIQQKPMVIANAAFERPLQLRDLAPQLAQGDVGQSLWTLLALTIASSIARPLLPMVWVTVLANLMLVLPTASGCGC